MADKIAAGRVAIVTGAGSGIGLETAKLLAASGTAVVGIGRDTAKLARLESEIGNPALVATLSVDVTAPDASKRIVDFALERFGRIDCLVNNAGIGSPKPLDETDDATLDQFLDIMLVAPFRLCREVIRTWAMAPAWSTSRPPSPISAAGAVAPIRRPRAVSSR